MREQSRDPGIMESNNLTDAEFKTLVIKMLNELRGSVDEFSETFNKEIKNRGRSKDGGLSKSRVSHLLCPHCNYNQIIN